MGSMCLRYLIKVLWAHMACVDVISSNRRNALNIGLKITVVSFLETFKTIIVPLKVLPDIPTSRIAIKLKPAAERMAKKSHPWVFSDSIIKQNKQGQTGDLAIIFNSKTNKFLACGLFDPDSPIRIKLIQFHDQAAIDQEWFRQKITEAKEKRESLLKTDTNSYRLIFGENDGLPGLIADVYDDVLVIKLYSAIWLPYFNVLLPELINIAQVRTVVLRLGRNLQRQGKLYGLEEGQTLFGEIENEVVQFKEHGVWFSANVISGHKTGYFLDHRHNRKRVGELAAKQTVLDVFSYAGGFSVHALAGGAKSVTSLDVSKQALEQAKYNAALNPHEGKHEVLVADAFTALEQLIAEKKKFDVVIIDPPSFAKSKSDIQKALKSYELLAGLGCNLTADGGLLVLASCSTRVSAEMFYQLNERCLADSGRYFEIELTTEHDVDHPIGFPEGAYLKCGYYRFYD